MRLKPGVNATGIRPEIVLALACASDIWRAAGYELTVTSLLDGEHSHGSLHYAGCAADLRTRDLPPGVAETLCDRLKEALGPQYDVILEGHHAHVEYQPKVGA